MRKVKAKRAKRAAAMPITRIDPARAAKLGVTPFDVSEFLTSPEVIAEYLALALEDRDDDPAEFLHALGAVAKARGMAQIARDSGLSRESLYKAFAPGASPRHQTVARVLGALGLKISVAAA